MIELNWTQIAYGLLLVGVVVLAFLAGRFANGKATIDNMGKLLDGVLQSKLVLDLGEYAGKNVPPELVAQTLSTLKSSQDMLGKLAQVIVKMTDGLPNVPNDEPLPVPVPTPTSGVAPGSGLRSPGVILDTRVAPAAASPGGGDG